ncbi:GNAT family N-acetyltransferase [Kitasatospora phosalacinea]|uniref:GNAT family N-acetyltransferase n=1 Tax=Kitasatospora phosalacinea TaxID=2065 RepID=UPI0035E03356
MVHRGVPPPAYVRRRHHFAVTDAGSGQLLGTVGLKKTDWPTRVSEVGYWSAPWARGRGVTAEATRALGEWLLGEQGFQRLQLFAATGNTASQRVAEKAGFQREGILRNAGYVHAGLVDLFVFSLVPGDLEELTQRGPAAMSRALVVHWSWHGEGDGAAVAGGG